MNILYLGESRVIKNILKDIVAKERDITLCSDSEDEIDIVFVDLDYMDIDEVSNRYPKNKIVAIVSSADREIDGIYTIRKPFLPKDIVDAISKLNSDTKETKVLELREIERVKKLLEETNTPYEDSLEDIDIDKSISYNITADEFIDILNRVKTKRLRKLLRGAEINISIKFPKD